MENDVSKVLDGLEELSSIGGVANKCYQAYRRKSLEKFSKDCWKALAENGNVNQKDFENVFSSEFAQEHIHRFFHNVLNSYSRIAQLALGKLFIDCFNRKIKYLTISEVRILRTLEGIEDHDIDVLLKVFELAHKYPADKGKNAINIYDGSGDFDFQFGSKEFDKHKKDFELLGINKKEDLKAVVQYFFFTGIFAEHTNVIVNDYSDLWLSTGSDSAKEFLSLIKWAKSNIDD